MSRTRKDRPYWVTVRDPAYPTVTYHRHYGSYWQKLRGTVVPGCDLAEFDAARGRAAGRQFFNCGRRPVARPRRHRTTSAPAWYIRHVWYGPERVRTRDVLGEAAKEYRAAGLHAHWAEDYDFPHYQHRHCAEWLWD